MIIRLLLKRNNMTTKNDFMLKIAIVDYFYDDEDLNIIILIITSHCKLLQKLK